MQREKLNPLKGSRLQFEIQLVSLSCDTLSRKIMSHAVFRLWKRFWRQNIPAYKVTDNNFDPIEESFFESELQKAEKVLKRRTHSGVSEVHVKWYQRPNEFNSRIPESDLKEI